MRYILSYLVSFLMIERLPHKWSIIYFKMVKRALQIWRKWVIGRRIRVVLHFKWDSQKFGLSIQKCNRKECRKVYEWKWFYLPSYIESHQWVKKPLFLYNCLFLIYSHDHFCQNVVKNSRFLSLSLCKIYFGQLCQNKCKIIAMFTSSK